SSSRSSSSSCSGRSGAGGSTSSASGRSARARAQSIARLTTIRWSQGPNGRFRSNRSSARTAERKASCAMSSAAAASRTTRDDTWAGWIWFAGLLLMIIGTIDFFQGLIAVIRGSYYTVTPNQIIVFDLTKWGWITLIWGIIVGLVGIGILSGQGWARWTAIV